ncbi:hypothetical protein ACFX13_030844 [Malus domestica]
MQENKLTKLHKYASITSSEIKEALAFSKAGLAQKPRANLLFQTCQHLSHTTYALDGAQNSKSKLRNRRGISFSRRVSICHMHTQLCGNHGQFVEAPISDIEEAHAFPDVSAPVTCTLSLAEITGNLLKISGEVEST